VRSVPWLCVSIHANTLQRDSYKSMTILSLGCRVTATMANTSRASLYKVTILRPRILVVEDDSSFARCVERIVTRIGAEVTVAESAGTAMLRLADMNAWSGFIVDVGLPDGSGLDVLSRARELRQSTPALILTGLLNHEIACVAFELHADYLLKPVTSAQLEEFLRRVRCASGDHLAAEPVVDSDFPEDLYALVLDVLNAGETLGSVHTEYAYRMALLARAASGRTHRGRSVIGACAKAVKISRSAFQEYIAVTTRWKPPEIRALLGLRDCHGRPVTLCHLLLVARAPGALRAQLEWIIREARDLRLLHRLVAAGKTAQPRPPDA
jgi:ActR/RegA family two-component response regulator